MNARNTITLKTNLPLSFAKHNHLRNKTPHETQKQHYI